MGSRFALALRLFGVIMPTVAGYVSHHALRVRSAQRYRGDYPQSQALSLPWRRGHPRRVPRRVAPWRWTAARLSSLSISAEGRS